MRPKYTKTDKTPSAYSCLTNANNNHTGTQKLTQLAANLTRQTNHLSTIPSLTNEEGTDSKLANPTKNKSKMAKGY